MRLTPLTLQPFAKTGYQAQLPRPTPPWPLPVNMATKTDDHLAKANATFHDLPGFAAFVAKPTLPARRVLAQVLHYCVRGAGNTHPAALRLVPCC